MAVVKSSVFNVVNNFFVNNSKVENDGRNQLIVLSDAGMGKTTLLVMIKLAHLTSFWPKQYKCKLLKIGKDTFDEISSISGKEETVILLDSLDEYVSPSEDSNHLLSHLLDATRNFKKTIITCRTQYTSSNNNDPFGRVGTLVHNGYVCPLVYLSPFDDSQVAQYLSKRFKRSASPKPVEKAQVLLDRMGSLRQRPFLLSHVEDLMDSDIESWDEENIYSALVKSWLLREQRKMNRYDLNTNIAIKEFHAACSEIASFMEDKGSSYVTSKELDLIVENTPSIKLIRKMEIGGRSFLNRDSDGNYRFSHVSLQEYFLKSKDLLLYAKNKGVNP